jgi:hypothetical protein
MALSLNAARRIARQPMDSVLRVYTFQHIDAWRVAQARGYLTGSVEHIDPNPDPDEGDFWRPFYDWMHGQMGARVPDHTGDYPVWAWVQRPNLRRTRWKPDEILIVADIPRRRALLSEHGVWHVPLNFGHCTKTEAEYEARYRDLPRHEHGDPIPAEMMQTWEQIFDLDSSGWSAERIAWCGHPTDIQACVDRIYLNEVVRVRVSPGRLGKRGGKD